MTEKIQNNIVLTNLTCVRPVVSDASAPAVPNLGQISSLRRFSENWGNVEFIQIAQILARPNLYNTLKVSIFKKAK